MRFSVQRGELSSGSRPRRIVAHALLILALLVAQIGALTHALSHDAAAQASVAQCASDCRAGGDSGETHQADPACALCSAFAGVATALVGGDASAQPAQQVFAVPPHETHVLAPAPFFSFSSRAPPVFSV